MVNYVNWELTQMLPEYFNEFGIWICSDNKIRVSNIALNWCKAKAGDNWKEYSKENCKVAIDWEDIRLYLKDKGFTLVQAVDTNDRDYNCIDVWQWKDGWEGELLNSFIRNTYEEARTSAIKYCLLILKQT